MAGLKLLTIENCTLAAPFHDIDVGPSPEGILYDSANDKLYAANTGGSTVSIIEGSTSNVERNITVGGSPRGIAYDAADDRVRMMEHPK